MDANVCQPASEFISFFVVLLPPPPHPLFSLPSSSPPTPFTPDPG